MKLHSVPIAAVAAALTAMAAAAQPSNEIAPVSVGIVLDTSGSMGSRLARARQLVSELLKSANARDEFTLIQAADRPIALSGFLNPSDTAERFAFIQPRGSSALLDGIYLGLQLMNTGRNERKVLLVISDGDDNTSRYTESEIRNAIAEAGTRIYTVGWNDPTEGSKLLVRIAERAGGSHFSVGDAASLRGTALELSAAMRAQP